MQTWKHFAISSVFLGLLFAAMPPAQAQFTTLYSFTGGADGGYPYDTPLYSNGSLYGTTFAGGVNPSWGVVFKMTTAGVEKTLYSFGTNPNDGANAYDSLVRDSAGNLYGTTQEGGTDIVGTIFEVTKTGKESILYNFFWQGGLTGFYPEAGLILDGAGNLYGVTNGGNNSGGGIVFQLTPTGTFNVLYSFTNGLDGGGPSAALMMDTSGNLYGTTNSGGASAYGTVFEMSPEPAGGCPTGSNTGNGWCETVLYSFTGGTDGGLPNASLIFDSSGNLYSTTLVGGIASCSFPSEAPTTGCGTVYKLSPAPASGCAVGTNPGNGWCETPLYAFSGAPDGSVTTAGLVMDSGNNLYGTTEFGGSSGVGTVFELSPETASGCSVGTNAGNGWCETVLHAFTGAYPGDGGYPLGGLAIDKEGNLYGTTSAGGYDGECSTCGYGTVFMVSAPAAAAVIMGSSQNHATVNQTVTFTATITSKLAVPDGELVTFTAGPNQVGAGTTQNGVATWTTSFSKAKNYTIKASYPGDTFHKPAHKTLKEVVNAE